MWTQIVIICICSSIFLEVLSSIASIQVEVNFYPATTKGDNYIRPLGASAVQYLDTSVGCNTQQVHITLGDASDEIIVSFVSLNNTGAIVSLNIID